MVTLGLSILMMCKRFLVVLIFIFKKLLLKKEEDYGNPSGHAMNSIFIYFVFI